MAENGGRTQSFPAGCRLSKAEEFASVLGSRRSFRGNHFQLWYRPAQARGARLGLIVGKKLAPRAVMRNRIKRLAREAFRRTRGTLPAYDLVLRFARASQPLDRPALRSEIDRLFAKLPR